MLEYAALVVSPRALPDSLILVFQHPVKPCRQHFWALLRFWPQTRRPKPSFQAFGQVCSGISTVRFNAGNQKDSKTNGDICVLPWAIAW